MDELNSELAAQPVMFAPELFQTELADNLVSDSLQESIANVEDPVDSIEDERGLFDLPFEPIQEPQHEDEHDHHHNVPSTTPRPGKKTSAKRDREKVNVSTKHSSKNEGQHTDRRYLCYICNKLFTRRRSVRDHIAKIHNTKTWEPVRSLEVIVEPHSGEPIEPLEDIIARGPPPPPTKEEKAAKQRHEQDEDDQDEKAETDELAIDIEVVPPVFKTETSLAESRPVSIEPSAPLPVIGKKRPLPINKKGTAKIRTSMPNKRPKLADSESSTPFRSPSVTPAIKAGSKLKPRSDSPTTSRASSRAVSASPSPSAGTSASSNDDGEIFCICRQGDNHTWMIACDGGCEEWFHGKCVNIRERDGDLIDRYICPNCRRDGLQTTWKRMCRRRGCRKPARVLQVPPSKYCSPDCGRMFFVELVRRGDDNVISKNGQYILEPTKQKKLKKKKTREDKKHKASGHDTPLIDGSRPHTPAYSDDEKSEYDTDSSLDDKQLPNRGGVLRAGEVKAIIDRCKTIEGWRDLGRKPVTPPREVDSVEGLHLEYDDIEKERLATIQKDLSAMRERVSVLLAREKLLELIKTRSSSITDEVKKSNPKMKELCGYDPRVTWSEEEFVQWWKGEGAKILESNKIGLPETNNTTMTNGYDGSEDEEDEQTMPTKGGVCIKNRCQRHGSNRWQKAQLAELRFEQDLVQKSINALEIQERGIRDRAVVRSWEKQ